MMFYQYYSMKYAIIAKISEDKYVKYHSDNLLSFTRFLDTKFSSWKWFNVYNPVTRLTLASYTQARKPTSKQLPK